MLFWLLYLHPRKIVRDKNIIQGLIVSVGHLSRIGLFMKIGNMSLYGALWCHFFALWVSGVYLFGQFSLSHTFMPTVGSDENPNWVRYALEHTVDIEPDNHAVSWIMGHLNNQVIHHLFPSMPQYRGPEVSKEMIVFCKKWDLKYTIITYREAWHKMFANLRKIGNEIYDK
jgi:fatty acid desaturase